MSAIDLKTETKWRFKAKRCYCPTGPQAHKAAPHTALGCTFPGCLCVRTRSLELNWRRINPGAYGARLRAKRKALNLRSEKG